ncbi:Translation initiation factor SUI1 family protein [Rhynchospora pubera]|uniref:Protein translation factor SUI1 homolog n=2 Tax=Rhynchospora pubera TaxID=906938 RepID=A0AAV8HEP4_9POAL|nr:Translation initiation factor SUI1 family protein [Rhynchospora pubera]
MENSIVERDRRRGYLKTQEDRLSSTGGSCLDKLYGFAGATCPEPVGHKVRVVRKEREREKKEAASNHPENTYSRKRNHHAFSDLIKRGKKERETCSILLLLLHLVVELIASQVDSSGPLISNSQEFMSDLDIQIPSAFDPFAEANAEEAGAGAKEYVHIRIQQRNGRKSLTTVQGLKKEFSYNKILKDLKKEFCCNGTVVQDTEMGQVIQLQGDQRKNVSNFLIQAGIVKKEHIKIHGF